MKPLFESESITSRVSIPCAIYSGDFVLPKLPLSSPIVVVVVSGRITNRFWGWTLIWKNTANRLTHHKADISSERIIFYFRGHIFSICISDAEKVVPCTLCNAFEGKLYKNDLRLSKNFPSLNIYFILLLVQQFSSFSFWEGSLLFGATAFCYVPKEASGPEDHH